LNLSTIVKPCQEKTFQQGDIYCLFDPDLIDKFTPEMLSEHYWQKNNNIVGSAQGRGTTWFVRYQHEDKNENKHQYQWVLKHYYRGGLIGKFNRDSYFYTGIKQTRAAKEFALLRAMAALGLPIPQPVAYRVIKKGLTYQADILTARIENAQDLVALLSQKALPEKTWQAIGRCIQSFHQQGIYHHDLNAHNVLLDENDKIWLIDFDQGEQRTPAKKWQQANIDRLLRSFHKEQKKIENFHWHTDCWQHLMEGYLS
jgi:3-deoxy-D-manno-octulosonic acid kinase